MRNLLVLTLLLAVALPVAAVEEGQVQYCGGTALGAPAGVIGKLDTTSETSLIFTSGDNKLSIPYADIDSFEYSREVTRHLGVLPAISVSLIKMRRRRHYFRISYHDNRGAQVVVFEVAKHTPRTLRAVLEARAPQTCKAPTCRHKD